jgi:exopolyphosphatase/pppGpp-phosphohydrolase
MRLGVLDVGSNTVHLLVVDAHPGARPLAEAAMELLGVDRLEICPRALREGVILRRLDLIAASSTG